MSNQTKSLAIPHKMNALVALAPVPDDAFLDAVRLAQYVQMIQTDIPVPKSGEVLIKVSRGTINPNDLYHIKGIYSATPDLPFPRSMGFEGTGVVVASGGGLIGRWRIGQRVAFYAMGMFAEYVVCNAIDLIDIPKQVDDSAAACAVANPMTAIAMIKVAQTTRSRYIINTAAASALGKLLIHFGQQKGIEVICIVRRAEQVKICHQAGAKIVLNTSDPDFDLQLKMIVQQTGCHLAFDCVAGGMPDRLLQALPEMGGVVKLYGYLSSDPMTLRPQSLFTDRHLETFEINAYLSQMSLGAKGCMAQSIRQSMGKEWGSQVQKTFHLHDSAEALSYYSQHMTAGKVQIVMDGDP